MSWQPFKLPLLKSAEVKGLLMHPAPLSRLQTAWHSTTNTLRWFCVLQHLLPEPGWDAESSPALAFSGSAECSGSSPELGEISRQPLVCYVHPCRHLHTGDTSPVPINTGNGESAAILYVSSSEEKRKGGREIIPISSTLCVAPENCFLDTSPPSCDHATTLWQQKQFPTWKSNIKKTVYF